MGNDCITHRLFLRERVRRNNIFPLHQFYADGHTSTSLSTLRDRRLRRDQNINYAPRFLNPRELIPVEEQFEEMTRMNGHSGVVQSYMIHGEDTLPPIVFTIDRNGTPTTVITNTEHGTRVLRHIMQPMQRQEIITIVERYENLFRNIRIREHCVLEDMDIRFYVDFLRNYLNRTNS